MQLHIAAYHSRAYQTYSTCLAKFGAVGDDVCDLETGTTLTEELTQMIEEAESESAMSRDMMHRAKRARSDESDDEFSVLCMPTHWMQL